MYQPNRTANYVKPSKEKQWQERSDAPSIDPQMDRSDIESHRINLIKMYNCEDTDVTFTFERIDNEADDDRDTFLLLTYWLRQVSLTTGEVNNKNVFSIKVKIPEHLRAQSATINKSQRALPPSRIKKPQQINKKTV